jgi:hypothetical protein
LPTKDKIAVLEICPVSPLQREVNAYHMGGENEGLIISGEGNIGGHHGLCLRRDCGRHAQKDYWDDFLHGRFPPRTWKIMVGDFHFFKWFAFFLKIFIK